MKNAALILFGLCMGGCAALILWVAMSFISPSVPESASYESIADLHKAMLGGGNDLEVDASGSVSLRSIVVPHPNDEIIFDLQPNLDVTFQRAPTSTNSCGMRGPEIKRESDSLLRIAVLGDSFAFGWGVKEEEAFPRLVESYLQGLFSEQQIEVVNLGVPGYSTFQQVALFEEKLLGLDIDIVLVFFVENDFGLPFFLYDSSSGNSLAPVQRVVRRFWETQDKTELQERDRLNSLADPSRSLLRLEELAKQYGFLPFVAINPRPEWKSDYSRLWAFRESSGVLTHLPLRRGFMTLFDSRGITAEELSLDFDPHPSPIKHKWLAELLAASLHPYLHEYFFCENCKLSSYL